MSLDESAVRILLRGVVRGMATYPGDAYLKAENRPFTPPDPATKQVWIEERVSMTSERNTSNGLIQTLGMAQYRVAYPVGKGTEAPGVLAEAILDAFAIPRGLTDGSVELALYRAERGSPSSDDLWYYLPVFVLWRAHVATSTP